MTSSSPNERWYASGDPWVLSQTAWEPAKNIYSEAILTQSNGYMGVRAYTEEKNEGVEGCREGYLAGVFGETDEAAREQTKVTYGWRMLAMITLPELFGCAIELNGERFELSPDTVVSFRRDLDMRNGELVREVVWQSPSGHRSRLCFKRFLSAAVPHLGMQEITLTAENWSGPASVRFELDGNTPTLFRCGERTFPHIPQYLLEAQRIETAGEGAATLAFQTRGTGHSVAITSAVSGVSGIAQPVGPGVLRQTASMRLREGKPVSTLHTVTVVSSRDNVAKDCVAIVSAEIAREAQASGYAAALAESTSVWRRRWKNADIEISGPGRDQVYVRFSAFSMLQMAPFHTDTVSIPARAYAYNRYHGLYYWDGETFLVPYYLHTHPDVAKKMLSFRHCTLEGARRTARRLAAPGACFPWMTDSDDGAEQAPWAIGDYVWHQNADIAYAVDQYVWGSGDTAFMWDKGLEMITESARFWMSRIEEDDAGVVHLHNTVGPDELDRHGRDNGYTSLMARRHLRLAARWVDRMLAADPDRGRQLFQRLEIRPGDGAAWARAANRLAAPNVPGHDFPLQDEFLLAKKRLAFDGLTADEAYAKRHTHRVVKQSDIVLVMYLLQDEFTVEQMRAAYDFYEPMTLHFSSLSYNTHSILATKIGREQQAYDYFLKAAGLDLDDLRDATKDGLHAAALGGTWLTVVYGFLGMRPAPDGIAFEPRLPEAWDSVSLRIAFRGFQLNLTLTHETHIVEVDGRTGLPPAQLILNGEPHTLEDGLRVSTSPKVLHGA